MTTRGVVEAADDGKVMLMPCDSSNVVTAGGITLDIGRVGSHTGLRLAPSACPLDFLSSLPPTA
jgi:hypothetical protein